MKARLLSLSLLNLFALLWGGFAQAQTWFWLNNNYASIHAPVFDAQGSALAGTNFLAELWGGRTSDSLSPAVAAYTHERVIIPFRTSGLFRDDDPAGRGYSTVFSVYSYPDVATLQVRAWDARLGATYEEAVAAGLGGYGESPIFSASGSSPFCEPPCAAAPLLGLQSFSLRAEVPEPSIWILLGVGGIGLWWRLRRRV